MSRILKPGIMNDGVGSDDGPDENTEAADEFLQGQEGKDGITLSRIVPLFPLFFKIILNIPFHLFAF